jgi:hypothetical protein
MIANKGRVAWLSAAVVLCAAPTTSRGGPPTAEDVLKVWQAREEKVKTARFEWDKRQVIPKNFYRQELGGLIGGEGPQPPSDLMLNGGCRLSIGYGVMRYEYDGEGWSIKHSVVRPSNTLSSFDGKIYKRIHVKNLADDYPDAVIKSTGKNTSTEFNDLAIRPLWLTVRGAQSVAQHFPLLLHEPADRMVTINGRPCLEFVADSRQVSVRSQMYFDVERDYQLTRRIETTNDVVTLKLDVTYAPHPEMGWLPDKWEYVVKDRRGRLGISVACKLTSAEINPVLPEGEFDAQFPPWTRVTDLTGEKEVQYVVRDDGAKGREIVQDGRNITYEQLVEAAREPFPWRRWLLIGSAVGIVLMLAALVWRRFRRRPHTEPSIP